MFDRESAHGWGFLSPRLQTASATKPAAASAALVLMAFGLAASPMLGCSSDSDGSGQQGTTDVQGPDDDGASDGISPISDVTEADTDGLVDPGGTKDTIADADSGGQPGTDADASEDEGGPQCGEFGTPCTTNIECCSGFCMEDFDGFRCTQTCVENCPEGYDCKAVLTIWPDVVTICVPNTSKLCQPCVQDLQCNGGQCIPLGGGTYCTVDCSIGDCPEGYDCVEAENGAKRCIPANGTCDCTEENDGLIRPCANINEFGACSGFQTCQAESGWSDCDAITPAPEVCNGIDDNCKGGVDEGLPTSQACSIESEFGSCAGEAFCLGAAGWVCNAAMPTAEVCDFLDNDCNGLTDETFKNSAGKYSAVEHCGTCGKSCVGVFPNATALCDTTATVPTCAVDTCEPGFYKANNFQCLPVQNAQCQPCIDDFQCGGGVCVVIGGSGFCASTCAGGGCPSGFQCVPSSAPNGQGKGLACMPISDACDCLPGNQGQKKPCVAENGVGTCLGFQTCNPPQGWSNCDAQVAAAEICNGVDDDCNGLIDDGLPASQACQNTVSGIGTCTGTAVCLGPAGWVCNASTPQIELCDFIDNDCDGLTDENFKNAQGKYALDTHCGSCAVSCLGAIPNAQAFCNADYPSPLCTVADCAPGFFKLSDFICLPEGESDCKPCQDDINCDGKTCVSIGDGNFCSSGCADDGDCAGGYECTDVPEGKFCVPMNGSCDCTPLTAGAKKPCAETNDIGTCAGFSVCEPAQGWLPCNALIPAEEVCDGLDNNCDGFVDNGLEASVPCSNANQFGTCEGQSLCLGAQGWVCNAKTAAAEICDFQDNDCDALVDEDFRDANGKYSSDLHCGTCNSACGGTIQNAASEFCDGSLAAPKCVVGDCQPGFFKVNDFQCVPTPNVTCFPCLNDAQCFGGKCTALPDGNACLPQCTSSAQCSNGFQCNNGVCTPPSGSCDCTQANAGAKKFCSNANAFGECLGFSTCNPATGWSACDASTPAQEVCNGLDDDCNGIPDNGLPLTQACQNTNAFGTCAGTATCLGPQGYVCAAPVPAAEICDLVDNDCDGQIDEDFKNSQGKYASSQHCGGCNKACGATIANAASEVCDGTKQVPSCVVGQCAPGFFKVSEVQCIPQPAVSCSPCVSSDTCFGGVCTPVGQSSFCLQQCSGQSPCPSGYGCQNGVCFPSNGSCDCSAATAGAKRTCTVSNALGTCLGLETCNPAVGWTGCTASAATTEVCNGIDDDCDGIIDDGLPSQQVCATKNDWGQCSGFAQCFGSAGWVCQAQEPGPEICDFKDNNCDGQIDENFKDAQGKYSLEAHCGTCNNPCGDKYPNSLSEVCDASKTIPQCVVESCEAGYFKLSDFQCLPIPDVACSPCASDANCFGAKCMQVDTGSFCIESCNNGLCPNGYFCSAGMCLPNNGTCDCNTNTAGAKRACFAENSLGTCFGFQTCNPASGWGLCDAKAPSPEVCNGLDDDCDGFIDDGLPNTQPCEKTVPGVGTCSGSATCFGSVGWFCQAPEPTPEICDFKDNDCDGLTDEDFKSFEGKYASNEHCGACGVNCNGAIFNASSECDPTLAIPQCVVSECENGWQKYNDFLCIPVTATLCEPCATDDNCLVSGAKCVPLTDGFACTTPCDSTPDCPSGYVCTDVEPGNGQCVPISLSCLCDGSNQDLQIACNKTFQAPGGPATTCFGTQYCTLTGWTECVLPVEQCNGIDDNCDGTIDEDFKDAAGKYTSADHCGKCNRNCAMMDFNNGFGVCDVSLDTPDCSLGCLPGFFDVNENPNDGCECALVSATDLPDGVDQNCDGVDGEINNAVFVSKEGNDTNPGTIGAPKLTIQAGVNTAQSQGRRDVYVATGVYSANITLVAGVSVYGGYSGNFKVRDVTVYETAIIGQAPTPQARGAVNALDISGAGQKTIFDGFTVFGVNNTTSGGNSYAIYVRNASNRLEVRNNRIFGGSGGNGAPGAPGGDGQDGVGGNNGAAAKDVGGCAAGLVVGGAGGAGGSRTCGGVNVSGGKGGDAYCPNYQPSSQNSNEAGMVGGNGGGAGGSFGYDGLISSGSGGGSTAPGCVTTTSPGCGGCACQTCVCQVDPFCCATSWDGLCVSQCISCGQNCSSGGSTGNCGLGQGCNQCLIPPQLQSMSGGPGATGKAGVFGGAGQGCSGGAGSVVNGEWTASPGAVGGGGTSGGGGGGGGAGGGVETCGCGGSDVGGTGGGGGSGGCSGTGGTGGQSGGGSFGIFLVYTAAPASAPVITGNVIQLGPGGLGGAGGTGGVGGLQGQGGLGGGDGSGNNSTWCAAKGGAGGAGGPGGHGGGGGGGCGGASYGIFAFGQGGVSFAGMKTANTINLAVQAAAGGQGGLSLGNQGFSGSTGAVANANF